MMRRDFLAGATAAALVPARARAQASAGGVAFDGAWRAATFRRIPPTTFRLGGDTLEIEAVRSSSLIWRPVPEPLRGARQAAWSWQVTESVPATDLTRRGGDDRNIALYFVFADATAAAGLDPDLPPGRLLARRGVRALVQVWGGSGAPGTILPNPWMRGRGVSVLRRQAGTGSHDERVDLATDHARAFGTAAEVLVGLAVSSDSDDTASRVEARVSRLSLG
jgi:hypothetical protein